MNLHLELNVSRSTGESRRLWQDGRVWWVNCVAIESRWYPGIERDHLFEARRRRDLMLATLAETW